MKKYQLFNRNYRRVIDMLRKMFPSDQYDWVYDPQGYFWYRDDGAIARKEAYLAPRYDGDDDNFVTYIRVTSEVSTNRNEIVYWGR